MSEQIQHRDDDYLSCEHYQSLHIGEGGFYRFEQKGKFYFSFIDDARVILRSEGYSSEIGRENGIASVTKNMDIEERYSTKQFPDGRWVLSLKALNNQEIARSCPFSTEDEAKSLLPSSRKNYKEEMLKLAQVRAGSVAQANIAFSHDNENDDYMICREYEEKYDKNTVTQDGYISFQHENTNQYYFAWVDKDGSIILRSESYPTAGARDNGLESVRKNRDIEERYKIIEERGIYYLVLKAGNHQEIGRSCPYKSEAEARLWLPSERAKAEALRLASATATDPILSPQHEEDDYMICREYIEQYHKDKVEDGGFIRFYHENTGKYYFAWFTDSGDVILRSEGYPTSAARNNGMESVRKNRDNRDRYKTEEKRGLHYLILRAGNNQEIGRSCPKDNPESLWGLAFPIVKTDVAPEKIAAPSAIGTAAALGGVAAAAGLTQDITPPDKADDYLACDEYKGHAISDKTNNIAFFKHKNGQFYFVVYNTDGSVRLRSEGFRTAQQRDQELKGVIKYMNNTTMYETIERAGHVFYILKDATGREVGRSCAEKKAAAVIAPVAPVVASVPKPVSPKVVPPVVAPASTDNGGFNWWWLLPLLLLLPLFFWWKSCNNPKVEDVSAVTPAPVQTTPTPVDTTASQTPTPTAPSCDLNWILFDYDKYNIRPDAEGELQLMAKILNENTSYVGVLKAYTDSKGDDTYNQRLSENRASSAKAFLVKAGVDASRITTSASSESAPIAKNTDDDSGRKYNRRVELYVKDNSGLDICKSIPPSVPSELKGN